MEETSLQQIYLIFFFEIFVTNSQIVVLLLPIWKWKWPNFDFFFFFQVFSKIWGFPIFLANFVPIKCVGFFPVINFFWFLPRPTENATYIVVTFLAFRKKILYIFYVHSNPEMLFILLSDTPSPAINNARIHLCPRPKLWTSNNRISLIFCRCASVLYTNIFHSKLALIT